MTGARHDTLVEIRGLTKRFPGVTALDAVDLDIRRGETHVLLGENGAGKSTLIKVLSGVYRRDDGAVRFDGSPYAPTSPRDALDAGIRVIHQEFNLLGYLSVAENILFDRLPSRRGLLDFRTLHRRARELMDDVGLDVAPGRAVEDLTVAQRQLVEIGRAISTDCKLLIMDEPTASLTSKETTRLFEIIDRLQERGVTVIYISHRLQEVFEVGDRFTVLRNGRKVDTRPIAGSTVDDIVRMMVGHELATLRPFRDDVVVGEPVLEVAGLRTLGSDVPVSFAVRAGELLGFAGLIGAGRTEVLRAVFGADRRRSGEFRLDGESIAIRTPRHAVRRGISLLTENRAEEGLVEGMPVAANITLTNLAAISRAGLLDRPEERRVAGELVDELSIKTPSLDQDVRNLSGGNQQKVVLAKWLYRNARVLMVDEPTRGIDVGARYEIYDLLWDLAARGKAILVVSSDIAELMGICHRIVVFSDGTVTGELEREQFDQERILSLAYQEYLQTADRVGQAGDAR